jgi:hypothetical protein
MRNGIENFGRKKLEPKPKRQPHTRQQAPRNPRKKFLWGTYVIEDGPIPSGDWLDVRVNTPEI